MGKIGLFYGSTMGNTRAAAETIASTFGDGVVDLHDVGSASGADLAGYSNLILGSSTWGLGDLQDDWDGFIGQLEQTDLTGKTVAVFGLGDQEGYPDTFVDAIAILAEAATGKGAKVVGACSTDGYDVEDVRAVADGKYVGLPLDDDNQSDLSDARIAAWVDQLKKDMEL